MSPLSSNNSSDAVSMVRDLASSREAIIVEVGPDPASIFAGRHSSVHLEAHTATGGDGPVDLTNPPLVDFLLELCKDGLDMEKEFEDVVYCFRC